MGRLPELRLGSSRKRRPGTRIPLGPPKGGQGSKDGPLDKELSFAGVPGTLETQTQQERGGPTRGAHPVSADAQAQMLRPAMRCHRLALSLGLGLLVGTIFCALW